MPDRNGCATSSACLPSKGRAHPGSSSIAQSKPAEGRVKTLTIRLEDDAWERLCQLQARWGLTLDEVLTQLIQRLDRLELLTEQTIGDMRDEADLEARVLTGIMTDRERTRVAEAHDQ